MELANTKDILVENLTDEFEALEQLASIHARRLFGGDYIEDGIRLDWFKQISCGVRGLTGRDFRPCDMQAICVLVPQFYRLSNTMIIRLPYEDDIETITEEEEEDKANKLQFSQKQRDKRLVIFLHVLHAHRQNNASMMPWTTTNVLPLRAGIIEWDPVLIKYQQQQEKQNKQRNIGYEMDIAQNEKEEEGKLSIESKTSSTFKHLCQALYPFINKIQYIMMTRQYEAIPTNELIRILSGDGSDAKDIQKLLDFLMWYQTSFGGGKKWCEIYQTTPLLLSSLMLSTSATTVTNTKACSFFRYTISPLKKINHNTIVKLMCEKLKHDGKHIYNDDDMYMLLQQQNQSLHKMIISWQDRNKRLREFRECINATYKLAREREYQLEKSYGQHLLAGHSRMVR